MTTCLILKSVEQPLPSKLHLHSQNIFSCPPCFIDRRTDPSDPIQSTHTQSCQMLSATYFIDTSITNIENLEIPKC